ncbi:hypothetical protein ACGFWI_05200 [Streptomyces sp. NPDC048434]|uniref:hypothetical protein n=1 Tax=Streptomyces sp. NPDC048434 TaxID=3365549 RepID=UPI0037206C62
MVNGGFAAVCPGVDEGPGRGFAAWFIEPCGGTDDMFSAARVEEREGARHAELHVRLCPGVAGGLSAAAFRPTVKAALLLLSPLSAPAAVNQALSTPITE